VQILKPNSPTYLKMTILLFKIVASLLVLIVIYLLVALVLSGLYKGREQSSTSDIDIYISTNGVHTDIIVPTESEFFNWRTILDPQHTIAKDSTFKYTSFGWGDKGFYLDTPTWADLKFSTAFKATFGLSQSAMHVTYYHSMEENKNCIKISLNKNQYLRLIDFIKNGFQKDTAGEFINIKTDAVYGDHDAFYDAIGSYNLFKTCNTWANTGLKSCGQKACIWTPSQSGIFFHYR